MRGAGVCWLTIKLEALKSTLLQKGIDSIIHVRWPCHIFYVAFGHKHNKALARSGQKYAVRIRHICAPCNLIDALPLSPFELKRLPRLIHAPKIGIPAQASPIKF